MTRNYYTGSMVSTAALEDMISSMVESGTSQADYERLTDSYRQHMISALEFLDDRLWWQPETSEIFWEDDGSENPLPEIDFEGWWNQTTTDWVNEVI